MLPVILMPALDTFSLGPLTIHVWGLLVAAGFAAGVALALWRARRRGETGETILDLALWILAGSLVGARLFHVFVYEPGFYFSDPWEIIKFWKGGMSSFGGFLGAAIAGSWYLKRRNLLFFKWADAAVFGLPLGMAIGRFGCFFTRMHTGVKSDFFLAVRAEDGSRLDLGLLESILAFGVFLIFLACDQKRRFHGFFLGLFLVLYGPARFFLDFLRATDIPMPDARYGGLTPAQYGSLLFTAIGVALFLRYTQKKTA